MKVLYLGIFVPKWDENGEWRRLHNEELHSLYGSPNIVRVIKFRRLRWAGNVARMEESRTNILAGTTVENKGKLILTKINKYYNF